MTDPDGSLQLPVEGAAPDRSRCVLCGGPNDCAMAEPIGSGAVATEPCWCVDRRFPERLVQAATGRDGGSACICRRCVDRAIAEEGAAVPGR